MLPLRDRNPSGITPWVVYSLVAVNVAVFLFEISLRQENLKELFFSYGLVPANVTGALSGKGHLFGALMIPAFTCMFLHGGWIHLAGNMWFLWIFGDNVEGRLGHLRFIAFYLVCGLAASLVQYSLGPGLAAPIVGASGAIAGVLGAYALCWPGAKVLTLVPVFYFITFVEIPAVIVLGFWFVMQFFQGMAALGAEFSHTGVAYGAHVGGFLAGMILVKLLRGARRRPARRTAWRA